jgi:hypothetical protein
MAFFDEGDEPGTRLALQRQRDLPPDGEWPCQVPSEPRSERLVAFLYQLLREQAPGDIEQAALNVRHYGERQAIQYTNPHLEKYARALATFLTPDVVTLQPVEYPHADGDALVLGPGVIARSDGEAINWRGEHYVKQGAE